MADPTQKKRSLPAIPEKVWWAFRAKMTASIPSKIGPDYLEVHSGMSSSSAKKIFNYLVTLGLVTEDFAATDRLRQWRMDDTYAQACKEIIDEVYPQELRDVAPGPIVERDVAKRWFMKTDLGEVQASQCAAMYALISEADPSKAASAKSVKPKTQGSSNGKSKPSNRKAEPSPERTAGDSDLVKTTEFTAVVPKVEVPRPTLPQVSPTVHLNLQIHISPDLSAEQIEKVFESMGKHIFSRG
jgi:hypothetical protein